MGRVYARGTRWWIDVSDGHGCRVRTPALNEDGSPARSKGEAYKALARGAAAEKKSAQNQPPQGSGLLHLQNLRKAQKEIQRQIRAAFRQLTEEEKRQDRHTRDEEVLQPVERQITRKRALAAHYVAEEKRLAKKRDVIAAKKLLKGAKDVMAETTPDLSWWAETFDAAGADLDTGQPLTKKGSVPASGGLPIAKPRKQ